MRFSIHLPLAVATTLVLPSTALARSNTGFVRVAAPAPDTEAAPSEGGPEADINPEEEAMTLFRAGQIAYRNQDFRRALEFFQDAQSRHPSPIFHFNIGLCYEALDKPEQAVDAYRAYLRSGPEDRGEIEGKIAKLEEKLAAKKDASPEAAPTPEPTDAPETAEAGPEAPAAADPANPTDDGDGSKPGRALIITGAALTVVGAAVAGGIGGWQGAVASDKAFQVYNVSNDGNPEGLTFDETETLDEEGRRANTLAITATAAGAAVGLTGVALLVVGVLKNKKAKQSASLQVTPTADRTSAGLSLSGRF